MMGKTHVAGALAAWSWVHPALSLTALTTPQEAAILAVSLGGTVLSGLLPDLDQPGSTIDQEIFGPLGKTRIGALLSGVVLLGISVMLRAPAVLHRVIHSTWLLTLIQRYSLWTSLGIGVFGLALIVISLLKHRGITHTLLGMGLFLWAADTLVGFSPFLTPWRTSLLVVFGAGYLSHLLLDVISDGVPLLYPLFKHRVRLPVSIRTGSLWDILLIRLGLLGWFLYIEAYPLIRAVSLKIHV